jgi:hypothetical protein
VWGRERADSSDLLLMEALEGEWGPVLFGALNWLLWGSRTDLRGLHLDPSTKESVSPPLLWPGCRDLRFWNHI